MPDSTRSEKLSHIGAIIATVLGLCLSSLYSYLIFHSLVEIITIAVAFTLFILTWNTRKYLANSYLRLLGIGYAFVALIDLLHTLAYKGMNVFPGYGANLPTQLWIAARYLQAATLLSAPLFVERKVGNRAIFGGYTAAVSGLVVMVYSGNFPDCYVEGKGLTPFKISSEYVITALLIASLYLLYRKRQYFNNRIFLLIASSIACTVLSEISFTTYLSVYDFANMAGHLCKLAAFYLIYRAILVTGLKEPFALVFRDLKQAQEALLKAHDTLEEKVRERTDELRASEEKYRTLIECANDAVFIHEIKKDGMPGPFVEVNELACNRLGYSREEIAKLSPMELDDPRYRDRIAEAMEQLLRDGHAVFETAQMTKDGRSIPVEVSTRVLDLQGTHLLFSLVRDISGRKLVEEALQRLNRELRAVNSCNQALLRAVDEQTLLSEICRIICNEAGYHLAWVGYAENDADKTVRPVAWAGFDSRYIENARLTWADNSERGQGPAGKAIRSGEIAFVQDFATDPQMAPWRESALQRGYRSGIALPLKDENAKAFGVLLIYFSEPNAITSDEIGLMETLASDLAFGITILRARIERKRAEEALKDSEAKYSDLYENAPDMYVSVSAETTLIEQCNHTLANALGYSKDEIIGRSVFEIYHPDSLEEAKRIFKLFVETGEIHDKELQLRKKDGSKLEVSLNVSAVRSADGRILYSRSTLRDITERKQAEEARRESQQRYRDIFDNVLDGLYLLEVTRDGRFRTIEVNPALEQITGIPRSQSIGKTQEEIVPEETARLVNAKYRRCVEAGQVIEEELELALPSGQHIFHSTLIPTRDETGRVYRIIGISRDITERRRAEEALRATSEILHALVEVSPLAIIVLNPAENIVMWNPAAEQLFGWTAQEIIGQPNPIVPAAKVDEYRALGARVMGGEMLTYRETVRQRKDGTLIDISISSAPLYDAEGQIRGRMAIIADITARKRAEEAQREHDRLQSALEEEKKLNNILNNMMRTISHEFRTPLTVISSSSHLLGHYHDRLNTDQRNEQCEIIVRQVGKLDQMVEEIVAAGQGMFSESAFQPGYIDMTTLAQLVASELQSTVGTKHQIVFTHEGQLNGVWADEKLINRILINLLSNAIKYSSPGGVIRLHMAEEGNSISIQVADQGIGISADDQKRLFEPFFRAGNVGKTIGLGLGLTIVRDCVALHQGTITVQSTLHKGTTFTVHLPKTPSVQEKASG